MEGEFENEDDSGLYSPERMPSTDEFPLFKEINDVFRSKELLAIINKIPNPNDSELVRQYYLFAPSWEIIRVVLDFLSYSEDQFAKEYGETKIQDVFVGRITKQGKFYKNFIKPGSVKKSVELHTKNVIEGAKIMLNLPLADLEQYKLGEDISEEELIDGLVEIIERINDYMHEHN